MLTELDQVRNDVGVSPGRNLSGKSEAVSGHAGSVDPAPAQAPQVQVSPAQVSPAQVSPALRVTRIVAASPWYETGLTELVRAYELLFVFTWRQIGVQYKQATLGIGWAVLSPLLSTIVFTFVFGNLAAIPSEGMPYPLFVLSGLITWQYFARAITSGSNSIVGNAHVITKVYFPRMILPLSAVVAGLVDYAVNLVVLLLLMFFYGRAPGVALLLLPAFLVLATMIGFAFSLWLSALNALYRDIGFMVPIALQAWMFLTPVIYPTGLLPEGWTWLLELNPMTAVVQGARWAVLPDATPPNLLGLAILAGEFILLFLGGVVTFHKIDAILADRI